MIMQLVSLIIWLLVIGVLYWVVVYVADNLIPEPPRQIIKAALVVIIALAVILLLLNLLGIGTGLQLPKLQ